MIHLLMAEEQSQEFQSLIELIPIGKGEAVSMKTLSKLLGLPSSDVRLMILNARKKGVLICSGDEGYYFPKNEDELKEYRNRRRKYIKTASIALRPFDLLLKSLEEGEL